MNADIYLTHAVTNVFDIMSNNILHPTEKTSLKRKWDNSVLALLKLAYQDQFDAFYYCKEFHKYAVNF